MKITRRFDLDPLGMEVKVIRARYVGDYIMRVWFSDGSMTVVDFSDYLYDTDNPNITKYRVETLLASFQIVDGNLNWGDYDLIFPVEALYHNRLSEKRNAESPA